MYTRFLVGVIAGLGSFTLAFEVLGAESPPPNFGTSSSSREVILRFSDGSSVRVGGKLALWIAEGCAALQRKQYEGRFRPLPLLCRQILTKISLLPFMLTAPSFTAKNATINWHFATPLPQSS
jgi:hypothetical protein